MPSLAIQSALAPLQGWYPLIEFSSALRLSCSSSVESVLGARQRVNLLEGVITDFVTDLIHGYSRILTVRSCGCIPLAPRSSQPGSGQCTRRRLGPRYCRRSECPVTVPPA